MIRPILICLGLILVVGFWVRRLPSLTVLSTAKSPAVYFGTEPSHATGLPRSDAYCASAVVPNSWEPRPENNRANHTVLSPPYGWSTENTWTAWRDKRARVTGNFTGTTTEIFQWAACKWGIDEDTIRAAAVQESSWRMSMVGDVCGPQGEASYGILQIKNQDCTGTPIQGGYPSHYAVYGPQRRLVRGPHPLLLRRRLP